MRVLNYKITSPINVKAEITRLPSFPITNETDSYYLVIPVLESVLPDNVAYIQECMLIEPHTTKQFVPKFVKLGVSLSTSLATKLNKGVELRLMLIEDILNNVAIHSVSSISTNNDTKASKSSTKATKKHKVQDSADASMAMIDDQLNSQPQTVSNEMEYVSDGEVQYFQQLITLYLKKKVML